MTKEIILTETEIFDNSTKYIEVPSSAITISLSDDEKVCFLIDAGEEVLPCGLLEEAYPQLLRLIKVDPQEALEKFKDVREEYEKTLGTKRAIFVGWINTQFRKNAPEQLILVIRQKVIAGIIRKRPQKLTKVIKELLKYCTIEDYFIGTYEQIFLLKRKGVIWSFVYSDVNKFPPTLYEGVSLEEGEFKKVYTYEKRNGLFGFFKETFEPQKKIKKKGVKPYAD